MPDANRYSRPRARGRAPPRASGVPSAPGPGIEAASRPGPRSLAPANERPRPRPHPPGPRSTFSVKTCESPVAASGRRTAAAERAHRQSSFEFFFVEIGSFSCAACPRRVKTKRGLWGGPNAFNGSLTMYHDPPPPSPLPQSRVKKIWFTICSGWTCYGHLAKFCPDRVSYTCKVDLVE